MAANTPVILSVAFSMESGDMLGRCRRGLVGQYPREKDGANCMALNDASISCVVRKKLGISTGTELRRKVKRKQRTHRHSTIYFTKIIFLKLDQFCFLNINIKIIVVMHFKNIK